MVFCLAVRLIRSVDLLPIIFSIHIKSGNVAVLLPSLIGLVLDSSPRSSTPSSSCANINSEASNAIQCAGHV